MGAYKYLNNFAVILAQAKELSLRRQGSLTQATGVSRSSEKLSLKRD